MSSDNFTKFPNNIFDGALQYRFSAIQLTVLLYVVRKVNGWGKPSDSISIKQMAKTTGFSRRAMINAVQDLEKMGVLYVERNGSGRMSDMRVTNPENWDKPVNSGSHVNSDAHVNVRSQGGVNGGSQGGVNGGSQGGVNGGSHTKEIYKDSFKENIKKGAPPSSFIEEDKTDEELAAEGWTIV